MASCAIVSPHPYAMTTIRLFTPAYPRICLPVFGSDATRNFDGHERASFSNLLA